MATFSNSEVYFLICPIQQFWQVACLFH